MGCGASVSEQGAAVSRPVGEAAHVQLNMPGQIITKMMLDIFKQDFASLDSNSNGVLEREEVRRLTEKQLGTGRATDEELNRFMSSFDADGDGSISFEEYLTVVLGAGWTIEGHDGEWWDADGTTAQNGAGDVKTSILYRRHNGKRQAATDKDTTQWVQSVSHTVKDARALPAAATLEDRGFALRKQHTGMCKGDYCDDAKVRSNYYPLCVQLVKEECGATRVSCFHHAISRCRKPGVAQCSYTVKSAFDLDALDRSFSGRVAVISVWRNINSDSPILNGHMVVCDSATLVCPDDFVFYNQRAAGGVTETFHLDPHNHHSHRWFYYSGMKADEALICKQFDSDLLSKCRYSFSSTINNNNTNMNFETEMIEVRMLAYFEQESDSMPWAPLPSQLQVYSVADSIRNDFRHLDHWDANGTNWVKDHAAKGNLEGNHFDLVYCASFRLLTCIDAADMISQNVQHHVREGKREWVRGLSAEQLEQAVRQTLSDNMIAQQIKIKLGVVVPSVNFAAVGKGDPRDDVVASINYRYV